MSNHSASEPLDTVRSEPRVSDPAPGGLHFGIGTFAFQTTEPDGSPVPGARILRDIVEQAVVAEEAGLDSFAIAEHYRRGMMDSAAPVVLGAIASRTERLKLGTAVTVLSTQDPVRVYNEYATLDAVSDGRAQLIVAPGGVPVWVGVGGSPQSALRAARFGLPLMLGIIGGTIERFAPLVSLYRQAQTALGQVDQPVGMHVHGYIGDTDDEAIERFWPVWAGTINAEAPKRGWAPYRRDRYDAEVAGGSLYVGSAETVARRIATSLQLLGASRFDFVAGASRMPQVDVVESIQRFGTEVVPRVRELLAADEPTGSAGAVS